MSNLVLDGAHTLNVTAGSQITSGAAGLSFSGTTTLNGHASIAVNNSAAASMQLTLASVTGAGQNLTIGGTGDTTIAGPITTTTGALTKQGAGTLTLQGASTYSGATNVQQGVLHVTSGSLAASSLTTISSGAMLIVDGGSFGGAVTGAGDVTKATTATLAFGGMNSYSGTTFVDAGTLMVNNLTSGQGDYIVASGARLGGNKTIGLAATRSIKVSPFPGELSPGAAELPFAPPNLPLGYAGHTFDATYSAGLDPLTVDTLAVGGNVILGGFLLIDLFSLNNHDVLDVSGEFNIGPSAKLEINGQTDFRLLDFFGDIGFIDGGRVDLVRAGTFSGNFSNMLPNASFVDAGGHSIFFGNDAGRIYLLAQSQDQPQAVPEPELLQAWGVAFIAAIGFGWRMRRCFRVQNAK